MKNYISIFIFAFLICSCQSTKIKNKNYKISPSLVELGSVGYSSSFLNTYNDFDIKTIPKLDSKIRLAVEILPFTKKIHKLYVSKSKFNQNQPVVNFSDSLPRKPEIVIIRLLDTSGFAEEINASQNETLLKTLGKAKNEIVSSVVVSLPIEDIAKIRQSDSYYLTDLGNKKYVVQLYKDQKKIAAIDISSGTILAYGLSHFCWASTNSGKFYVSDIIEGNRSCEGGTLSKINKKKASKNLFEL